jgi:hypothetical protein
MQQRPILAKTASVLGLSGAPNKSAIDTQNSALKCGALLSAKSFAGEAQTHGEMSLRGSVATAPDGASMSLFALG